MVLDHRYVVTLHADDELDADNMTVYDLEHIVLTGEIIERQKDKITGETKYRIQGQTIGNGCAETVIKISITGKVIFLTAYTL